MFSHLLSFSVGLNCWGQLEMLFDLDFTDLYLFHLKCTIDVFKS